MAHKYYLISIFSLVSFFALQGVSVETKPVATTNALDALDDYAQSPQEIMMKEMAIRLQQVMDKIFDPEQLNAKLTDKEKEIFAGLVDHERLVEELKNHADFATQYKILSDLQKRYEKKGASEENIAAFLKEAEVQCPVALQYMNFVTVLDQFKAALAELFKDAFFNALYKMDLKKSSIE